MRAMSLARLAALVLFPLSAAAQSPDTATTAPQATAARNARWSVPVKLEGVPNLHRITPTLYRSEQPTALGMKNLEKLGIRTVINLRFFNNDRKEAEGTGLRTERVKILTWNVDDEHVVEVMRMLRQPENGPGDEGS